MLNSVAYTDVPSDMVGSPEHPRHLCRTYKWHKLQECFGFLEWQVDVKGIHEGMSNDTTCLHSGIWGKPKITSSGVDRRQNLCTFDFYL